MAKRGGRQPGAGRPKGSTTRVRVLDHFTDAEITDFFLDLKERAKTDTKIAIYLAEQLTGKAPQAMDVTSNGDGISFNIINYADNNDSSSLQSPPVSTGLPSQPSEV